jgi:hypothetical protein
MSKARTRSVRLRRELLARQKGEAAAAARRLLAQPESDPREEAEKIDAYDAILNQLDAGPSLEKWIAAAVAAVCMTIVGLLYGLPRGQTKVLLELEAETVSFRLAAPFDWSTGVPVEPPLTIAGLRRLDAMRHPQPLQSDYNEVWLKVTRGEISLTELVVADDATVAIDVAPEGRRFYLGGALTGSLLASGAVEMQAGPRPDVVRVNLQARLPGPESFDFSAAGQGAMPTMLSFGGDELLRLGHIPVRGLAFARETRENLTDSHFDSTVVGGTLRLPEVEARVDLRPGEWLRFDALDGRLTRLDIGKMINLRFEGTAENVRVGPEGFERDLAPSWLAYLYNQERLAFVWSAFVFVWGILWSIRKTVFA